MSQIVPFEMRMLRLEGIDRLCGVFGSYAMSECINIVLSICDLNLRELRLGTSKQGVLDKS